MNPLVVAGIVGGATQLLSTGIQAAQAGKSNASVVRKPGMKQDAFLARGMSQDSYRGEAASADLRGYLPQDKTDINRSRADAMASRGAQGDAMGLYGQAARGLGPSAAQAQLRAGADAAGRQALSLGASARGTGVQQGAANLAAIQAASGGTQQAAAGAAALRAQEMQSAMAGYGGLAGQMRQADQGMLAGDYQNAQFAQDYYLKNRGINDERAMNMYALGQAQSQYADNLRAQYEMQDAQNSLFAQSNSPAGDNPEQYRLATLQAGQYSSDNVPFGYGMTEGGVPNHDWGVAGDAMERLKAKIAARKAGG